MLPGVLARAGAQRFAGSAVPGLRLSASLRLFAPVRLCVSVRLCAVLCLCAGLLFAAGCAHSPTEGGGTGYALEGPDLFIVGEYKGMPLEGTMERHVIVGIGKMEIRSVDRTRGFFCEARIKSPPQENLRIRGILLCAEGQALAVSMRPLGPDQGVGVGRQETDEDLLVFFFHPSQEEAERRFPQVRKDMQTAAAKQ